ncbi:transglutaminase-like domain-containing protein [Natronospora cellulosivora (SeqCode)]
MKLIPESKNIEEYLLEDIDLDYSHLTIREKVEELYHNCISENDKVKKAFEFVRDDIKHSWDIQSSRITRKASEVLVYKEGICYAKSNLLAALLRAVNIPAGFCYQRLTLGDTPETGYVIHALNAVYLSKLNKWIRLDARGNKKGINAQFAIDTEKLAFPIRKIYDEKDYPIIYLKPAKDTMDTLSNNNNCLEMYKSHLPSEI